MRRSRSKCALSAPRFDGARREGVVRHFETGAAALREGAKAAEQRPSKPFFQAFPNLRLFSPNISKESFGGFVGFQGVARVANRKSAFPNLFAASASFSCTPAAPQRFEGDRSPHGRETLRGGRDAFMGRSDPDAENLEPSLNFV
jgi:hypothetical protein